MIAYLRGKPFLSGNQLILDVNGVGYGVLVGPRLLQTIIHQDQAELHIFTYVKEDRFELYGLNSAKEVDLFKMILAVSGVGPKIAISLVDAGAEALINSIQQANLSFFTSIPRVGKKLAQKIIIELKSKLGSIKDLNLSGLSSAQQDVASALENLGFAGDSIEKILADIDCSKLTLEEAIKTAVKKAKTI